MSLSVASGPFTGRVRLGSTRPSLLALAVGPWVVLAVLVAHSDLSLAPVQAVTLAAMTGLFYALGRWPVKMPHADSALTPYEIIAIPAIVALPGIWAALAYAIGSLLGKHYSRMLYPHWYRGTATSGVAGLSIFLANDVFLTVVDVGAGVAGALLASAAAYLVLAIGSETLYVIGYRVERGFWLSDPLAAVRFGNPWYLVVAAVALGPVCLAVWRADRATLLAVLALLVVVVAALRHAVRQSSTAAQTSAQADAEQAALVRALVAASDQQRQQLVGLLHDGPLQKISGASVLAQLSLEGLSEPTTGTPAETTGTLRSDLDEICRWLVEAATETRQIMSGEGQAVLEEHGLTVTLEQVRESWQHRFPGGVTLEIDLTQDPPALHAQQVLFLILREALINAAKHARAKHAHVRVRSAHGLLTGSVEDDGIGLNPALVARRRAAGHLGTALIEERARAAGGSVAFSCPANGQGTAVYVSLPAAVTGRS